MRNAIPFDPATLERESEAATRARNESVEWAPALSQPVCNYDYKLAEDFEPYEPSGKRLDRFTAEYDDIPVHVTLIESGVLFGQEFLICDARTPTVSAERLYLTRQRLARRRPDIERLDVESGPTYLVGANNGHHNFYHWNFQCLPGIVLLRNVARERGLDYRIVLPPLDAMRLRTLEIAGVRPSECVTLLPERFLQNVPLLYTTATCGHYSFQPSAQLLSVMEPFRDYCMKHGDPSLPTRFYVSRRDAPGRRDIENESELALALKACGHKEMIMSALSIEDQVAAFARAESVVAPHGAGLVNLMHSPATARLVEILPENRRFAYFFRIAQVRGMGYSQVLATLSGEGEGRGRSDFRIKVDVDKVLATLEASEAVRMRRAA